MTQLPPPPGPPLGQPPFGQQPWGQPTSHSGFPQPEVVTDLPGGPCDYQGSGDHGLTFQAPSYQSPVYRNGWQQPAPVNIADLVGSVILLVALVGLCLVTSFVAAFSVMASDGCYGNSCNYTVMTIGFYTSLLTPWCVAALALVITVVRLVRRKLAFWIPLIGAVGAVGGFFLGFALTSAGLP